MGHIIHIGNWGIGVTSDRRVYIDYQKMDDTQHNEYDIRLYIDGNFGSVDQKIAYGKTIVNSLIKGELP